MCSRDLYCIDSHFLVCSHEVASIGIVAAHNLDDRLIVICRVVALSPSSLVSLAYYSAYLVFTSFH